MPNHISTPITQPENGATKQQDSCIQISNAEFVSNIFRQLDEGEAVATTNFPDFNHPNWNGRCIQPKEFEDTQNENTYFCPSSLTGNARTLANFSTLHAVVLDDIDTKALYALPAPTYAIETSAGNYQVGYVLATPITDIGQAKNIHKALSKKIYCDTNGNNPVRWVRLPVGTNTKPNKMFAHRLTVWEPNRRFRTGDLLNKLGLEIDFSKPPPNTSAKLIDPFAELNKVEPKLQSPKAMASLLVSIDPDIGREEWRKVLSCTHLHLGAAGYQLAHDWSAKGAKYMQTNSKSEIATPEEAETQFHKVWDGIACDHGFRMGAGVLFDILKKQHSDTCGEWGLSTSDIAAWRQGNQNAGVVQKSEWPFTPLNMSKVMGEAPKPIKWLCKQRIPGNRATLLTGIGGTSKTQWLYQLAISVITGECPWDWEVSTSGKVVLILTEDDEDDPHNTLRNICEALALSNEQQRKIKDNLIIYPLAGLSVKLLRRDPGNGTLIESDQLSGLRNEIAAIGDVALIGIDPALGVTEGDESSQTDQRALGRMGDDLAIQCNAAVVIITHGTKGSIQSDELTSHSSRGGGAITDAVRAELAMRTMTAKEANKYGINSVEDRESFVQLKITKGNRIPPAAKVALWFKRGHGGVLQPVELGEVTAATSRQSIDALSVLQEAFRNADNSSIRLQDWRQQCTERGIITGSDDAKKKAMARIVKSLGNRVKKAEGERGLYIPNTSVFGIDEEGI